MAIKQVFKIKDEILDDEYELSGQSGFLHTPDANLILIDTCQLAQVIIETCAQVKNENTCVISKEKISAMCNQVSNDIGNLILDSVYENAISDVVDDEEMDFLTKQEEDNMNEIEEIKKTIDEFTKNDQYSANNEYVKNLYRRLRELEGREQVQEETYEEYFIDGSDVPRSGRYE